MNAEAILIMIIIAVVVSIVVGTKFNINLGLIAFVLAAILGGLVLGISPRMFYTWWPTNIMLQIIGVTFFFGFVGETGAIKVVSDHMLYAVRNAMPLIPVMFFILAAGLGLLGVNPMGINALCLPIIASICMHTNRNPMFLFVSYLTGCMAGLVSPIGSAGIVASGMISQATSPELTASIMPRMYVNNFVLNLLCFVIVYIVFRGWKLNVSEEMKEVFRNKPEKANKQQKTVLIIMVIAVLVMVLPGILHLSISRSFDVGWVYMAAGVACALLKIGDLKSIISQRIPWGIILLVGGFTILLSIASDQGCFTLIAEWVETNVPTGVIGPVMALISGFTSLFSDSIGVVFPLYIPIAAGLLDAGVSATGLFSSIIIGSLVTGSAPFSTGGAMVLSFAPESINRKLFGCLLAFVFVFMALTCGMSALGLFG